MKCPLLRKAGILKQSGYWQNESKLIAIVWQRKPLVYFQQKHHFHTKSHQHNLYCSHLYLLTCLLSLYQNQLPPSQLSRLYLSILFLQTFVNSSCNPVPKAFSHCPLYTSHTEGPHLLVLVSCVNQFSITATVIRDNWFIKRKCSFSETPAPDLPAILFWGWCIKTGWKIRPGWCIYRLEVEKK